MTNGLNHFSNSSLNTWDKMKKFTINKIKLGVFITIGIAVFIAGIYFIGERQQLFRSTFSISGVFKDVGGLQAGSNIRFAGINVGTIENINLLSDTSVVVTMMIDENVRKFIKKDAVGSIGSEGLMGNKILIIIPGTGGKAAIENNNYITTVQPLNIDDILASLNKTINNASEITNDLALIMTNVKSGKGTIGRLLMDQSLSQNFDSAVVNLKTGSAELKFLMSDIKFSFTQNMDSAFVNLKESSSGFKTLVDKAKSSWLLWGF